MEPPVRKFVLLAHPRTATNYFLLKVLSRHPSIAGFREIFNNNANTLKLMSELGMDPFVPSLQLPLPPGRFPFLEKVPVLGQKSIGKRREKADLENVFNFLDRFFERAAAHTGKKVLGFKLFPDQVSQAAVFAILDKFPVIVLRRKNMPQAAVSHAISMKTRQWEIDSKEEFESFDINFDDALAFIQKYDQGLDDAIQYLRGMNINFLYLEYETLFRVETLRSLEDFLGLDVRFGTTEFEKAKMTDKARYQRIGNIEEIRQKFINRGYPDIYEIVYEDKIG